MHPACPCFVFGALTPASAPVPATTFARRRCARVRPRPAAASDGANSNNNDGSGIGPLPFSDARSDPDPDFANETRRRQMLDKASAYLKAKPQQLANAKQAANSNSDIDIDDETATGPTNPDDEGKVLLFGGWLDDDVAGQRKQDKATSSLDLSMLDPEKNYPLGDTPPDRLRKSRILAHAFFTQGNRFFEKGRYARAETFFAKATSLVGLQTRQGGQYELWVAQARDARGDKPGAKALLTILAKHSDADVKRVAQELDFILTAPSLNLSDESYIKMDLDDDARINKAKQYGTLSPRGPGEAGYAQIEKSPEKYSIEWFLEQPQKTPLASFNILVLASIFALSVVLLTLAYGPA